MCGTSGKVLMPCSLQRGRELDRPRAVVAEPAPGARAAPSARRPRRSVIEKIVPPIRWPPRAQLAGEVLGARRRARRWSRRAPCRARRTSSRRGRAASARLRSQCGTDSQIRAPSACSGTPRSRAAADSSTSSSHVGSRQPASRSGSSTIAAPSRPPIGGERLGGRRSRARWSATRARGRAPGAGRPARGGRGGTGRAARPAASRIGRTTRAASPAGPSRRWGTSPRRACRAARRPRSRAGRPRRARRSGPTSRSCSSAKAARSRNIAAGVDGARQKIASAEADAARKRSWRSFTRPQAAHAVRSGA